MVRQRVFFDFSISDERAGRVVFELFSDIVPKTCENFRALATGEMGLSQLSGQPLHYKNSIIHRSIPDFMVQGGDFTKRNGKGGESIYGAPFEDEDLSTDMDAEGLLCMANKGPNTNGSQWFVTLRPCPHLNGKHVVFGKVVHGFDVIVKISKLPVDEKDRPLMPVVIFHSGELELRKPAPKSSAQALSESVSSTEDATSKRKRRHSDVKAASEEDEEDRDRRRPTKVDEGHSEDSEDGRRSKKHSSKRKDKDRHRSSKKKHHKDRSQSRGDGAPENNVKDQTAPKEPQEETEEELDLRLEREEKERLQQAKLRELEELRKRPAVGPAASGGVNFKGRGRMKFRDPETSLRGW